MEIIGAGAGKRTVLKTLTAADVLRVSSLSGLLPFLWAVQNWWEIYLEEL